MCIQKRQARLARYPHLESETADRANDIDITLEANMSESDGDNGAKRGTDAEAAETEPLQQMRSKHAANTQRDAANGPEAVLPELALRAMKAGALVPVVVKEDEPGKFSYPSPVRWGAAGPPSEAEWRRRWEEWRPGGDRGVAIHLGRAHLVLIDLDTKNGHDGVASYMRAFGPIPDADSEMTPTGGLHILVREPAALVGVETNQITGLLDGIDVKWGNQIAVCAPTKRTDGEYLPITTLDQPEMTPAKVVEAVAARLTSGPSSVPGRSVGEIIAHGSDKGSRDIDLTRLMFWMLHKYGWSKDARATILAEARRWNESNCRPPLPDDTIQRKLMRLFSNRRVAGEWTVAAAVVDPWEVTYLAARQGDKSVGMKLSCRRCSGRVQAIDVTSLAFLVGGEWIYLGCQMNAKVESSYYRARLAASWADDLAGLRPGCGIMSSEVKRVIEAIAELLADDTGRRDRRIGSMDMEAAELPNDEWLIQGLVQRGVINILVGNGGIGKTTLALAMAHAVANGREGSEDDAIVPERKCPVYYYTAEDDWENLQQRSKVLRMGRDQDQFQIIDSIADEWDLFNRIRDTEGDTASGNFRVIDSISAVFGNLNDNEKVVSFMRGLRLARGTSLLLAHQSKGSMATGRGDPMGAVQWRNQARHVIQLSYDQEDTTLLNVTVEKHNGALAATGSVVSLKRNVDWGRSLWFSKSIGRTVRSLLMAGIAAGHRAPATLYAFADEHGVKAGTARGELSRLTTLGMVEKINRQLYTRDEADAMRLLTADGEE